MAKFVGGEIETEIDWGSELSEFLNEYVHDWMESVIKQEGHFMYLPIEQMTCEHITNYDGANKLVTDPLTIRFSTELCSDINGIKFDESLTDIIDNMIEGHTLFRYEKPCIDKESVPMFKLIADALQNEVNKLNAFIENAVEANDGAYGTE